MVAGIWPVVDSKNTSNGVFIQVQSKRQVDLLSDARATEPRVASLHFYNGIDDLLAWALRAWLESAAGGIQVSILPPLQCMAVSRSKIRKMTSFMLPEGSIFGKEQQLLSI